MVNVAQIPPHDAHEKVPLGSSSVSMYPGYSPADHEYGKAADEYGRYASSARAQGIDVRPKDVEYEIGQSKRMKRQSLGGTGSTRTAQESGSGSGAGSGSGSGSDRPNNKHRKHDSTNGHAEVEAREEIHEEHHERHHESGKPAFFIDVNPTPVELPPMKDKSPKRGASSPETAEGKKHKKIKKKHTVDLPGTTDGKGIEYEDISQEVDARLKEKEERRKRKEEERKGKEEERKGKEKERKRRRGSGESAAVEAEVPSAMELEKPKKKKLKKIDGTNSPHVPDATDSPSKKRHGVDNDNEHGEGKKKKRKKSKELP